MSQCGKGVAGKAYVRTVSDEKLDSESFPGIGTFHLSGAVNKHRLSKSRNLFMPSYADSRLTVPVPPCIVAIA